MSISMKVREKSQGSFASEIRRLKNGRYCLTENANGSFREDTLHDEDEIDDEIVELLEAAETDRACTGRWGTWHPMPPSKEYRRRAAVATLAAIDDEDDEDEDTVADDPTLVLARAMGGLLGMALTARSRR